MFTLGIDEYEKGVIGNTVIVVGVVEKFSITALNHGTGYKNFITRFGPTAVKEH